MTYKEKLKSPKWQKKRLEILQRDEFRCCYCNDDKTELQIHHLKYTNEPWDAPNENLITLCKHCHILISKYKSLKIIVIDKNDYGNNIIGLAVKFYDGNNINIALYFINNDNLTYITEFLIGGLFHKSIIKLTS